MNKIFFYRALVLRGVLTIISIILFNTNLLAQTCTVSGSGTINWAGVTCQETGLSPAATDDIIIPVGVTLNIPSAGTFSHSGDFVIFGTVINNKANALLNGSIIIKSSASFVLNDKMDLGSTAGCGYSLIIENGGSMELNGSGASDLLTICGVKIAQSGGGCTNCDPPTCPLVGNKPYCEPTGGFTGPLGYDENGYNNALPIELLYFEGHSLNMTASIEWATVHEENFDYFQLERSANGKDFYEITRMTGRGERDIATNYSYVDNLEQSGRYYYRLKSVDLDRSFEYSKIISVLIGDGDSQIIIYPNPISDRKFRIKGLDGTAQLVFSDPLGKTIMKTELQNTEDEIQIDSSIPSGFYFLKIEGIGFSKVLKFEVP